jgi:hypothetical protein
VAGGGDEMNVDWLIDLWDEQEGEFFCLSRKTARGQWHDHFIKRGAWERVEPWLDQHRHDDDCYFTVHGLTRPRRLEKYAVPSPWLWSDIDQGDVHLLEVKPTIAWRTSRGHYQAAWRLDREPSKGLRKGFSDAMGGDHGGWIITKALRVPGTFNYKREYPQRVTMLWDQGPIHRVVDLKKYEVRGETTSVNLTLNIDGINAKEVVAKYKVD